MIAENTSMVGLIGLEWFEPDAPPGPITQPRQTAFKPLHARPSDEYFVAIASELNHRFFQHSFLMLGVVIDGQPRLLTRVGLFERPGNLSVCSLLNSTRAADLRDEGIIRADCRQTEITYSANAITYQQTKDFIAFLEEVNEQKALDHQREDQGCCCVSMHVRPTPDLSNLPFNTFRAGYIRVINPQERINELYYADKRTRILTRLDANQRHFARLKFAKPTANEKTLVMNGDEVLIYYTQGRYHLCFVNQGGAYIDQIVDDPELLGILPAPTIAKTNEAARISPRYLTEANRINAINQALNRFQGKIRIHYDANDMLTEYDSAIHSMRTPQRLSAYQLKLVRSLVNHTHEDNKTWYRTQRAIRCYKPHSDQSNGIVTFHYTENKITQHHARAEAQSLYRQTQHFGLTHTCRDTAIALMNHARGASQIPRHVSSLFFRKLPVPTTLEAGLPTNTRPFYILPLPPTAFALQGTDPVSAKKRLLIDKLYQRMEDLIRLEADLPLTTSKFTKLKALYLKIAGDNFATTESLLQSIHQWRQQNPDIGQLRHVYFFDAWLQRIGITRESATDKCLRTLTSTP
jgi:hypothetical protein